MTLRNSSVSNEFNVKLESLNLGSVAQILISKKGWTLKQTKRAITDYKHYLCLMHQNPTQSLVPTQQIDEVLHAHIALGTQFDEDCKRLFDCAVYHESGLGEGDDTDKQQWLIAFQQTKQLFQAAFGLGLAGNPARCFIMTSV